MRNYNPDTRPAGLQTGIGRPLTPEYLNHFGALFRSLMPAAVSLVLRKRPGLTYVPSDELAREVIGSYRGETSEKAAEEYTEHLLGTLCLKRLIDENTSRGNLELNTELRKIHVRKKKSSYDIGLVLVDQADQFYDSQRSICAGEKAAVREGADLLADKSPKPKYKDTEYPTVLVRMGIIEDPANLYKGDAIRQLADCLPDTVELLPIGNVRLDH